MMIHFFVSYKVAFSKDKNSNLNNHLQAIVFSVETGRGVVPIQMGFTQTSPTT